VLRDRVKETARRWLPPALLDHVRTLRARARHPALPAPSPCEVRLDFVIVGAEKAGTTLLQEVLRTLPGVYMPAHEVRYFRDPFYGPPRALYDAIGLAVKRDLVGIKHPSYLAVPEAAERIYRHNPAVKIIVSLRDPAQRAISSYYHYLARGQIPPLHPDEAFPLILSDERARHPKYEHIFQFGRYHTHLKRFLEFFPPTQILLLEFERLCAEGDEWQRLFQFLRLHANPPGEIRRVNPGVTGWTENLVRHFSSRLTNRYDDSMNVVGKRAHDEASTAAAVEVFRSMLDQLSPVARRSGVSTATVERLVDAYREEVDALRESGWFEPLRWPNFRPVTGDQ
jgi:hypothetical protein